MGSLTLLEAIREQFARIVDAIPGPSIEQENPQALGEDGHHLFDGVFDLLSGGESLPFFRQNYLELSGYASQLADWVGNILAMKKELAGSEGEALSPMLESIKQTTSIFGSTWSKLDISPGEGGREIKLARAPLEKFEKLLQNNPSMDGKPGRVIALGYGTLAALLAIELALKKIIVIRAL